ncbi:MAG TPA: GYD domain-containing protein [Steroidobacteraceae bacterium]|nr:GYD domain-containing protein [Steroidobacteraceae bacterium]
MVKFLITGSYTADGAKALAKEGGSQRKAAVEKMLGGLGGKLEAFYFAFGDSDIYVIVDVPDTTSGAALTLAVNASGMVKISSVLLMTPEEVDAACKKTVSYRPPGR